MFQIVSGFDHYENFQKKTENFLFSFLLSIMQFLLNRLVFWILVYIEYTVFCCCCCCFVVVVVVFVVF